jgi:uncharacterized membrane protein
VTHSAVRSFPHVEYERILIIWDLSTTVLSAMKVISGLLLKLRDIN